MAKESTSSIRYTWLLDQLSRFIIPTDGTAKFTLKNIQKEFICDMAKIKNLIPEDMDMDDLELHIPYSDCITIVLTTLNF